MLSKISWHISAFQKLSSDLKNRFRPSWLHAKFWDLADLSDQIQAVGIHFVGWCSQKYQGKFSSSKSFQVTLKMDSDHPSCIPFFVMGIEFQPPQGWLNELVLSKISMPIFILQNLSSYLKNGFRPSLVHTIFWNRYWVSSSSVRVGSRSRQLALSKISRHISAFQKLSSVLKNRFQLSLLHAKFWDLMDLSDQLQAVAIHNMGWCSQKYQGTFRRSKSFLVTYQIDSNPLFCKLNFDTIWYSLSRRFLVYDLSFFLAPYWGSGGRNAIKYLGDLNI